MIFKKTPKYLAFCLFGLCLQLHLTAQTKQKNQDVVRLISGHILNVDIQSIDSLGLHVVETKKNGKTRNYLLDEYRVFSYTNNLGTEMVIYQPDTIGYLFLDIDGMRYFMQGQRDAWKGYQPKSAILTAMGIGGLASYLVGTQTFVLVLAPITSYFITMWATSPHIQLLSVEDYINLSHDEYVEGYYRVAKIKKNKAAMWSSLVGTALGAGIHFLTNRD